MKRLFLFFVLGILVTIFFFSGGNETLRAFAGSAERMWTVTSIAGIAIGCLIFGRLQINGNNVARGDGAHVETHQTTNNNYYFYEGDRVIESPEVKQWTSSKRS